MATYCVADIHGYYSHFMKLLDKIELSSTDRLYIIGDIIDRGPDTKRLLRWLITEDHKNIIMLKGNHEDMLASYITSLICPDANVQRAVMQNHPWTWNSQQYKDRFDIDDGEHDDFWVDLVLPWLINLPLHADITVNNRRFVLVHAGLDPRQWEPDALWCQQDALIWPGADTRTVKIEGLGSQFAQDILWSRDYWYTRISNDPVHIICGHTGNRPEHIQRLNYAASINNLTCDIRPYQICHVGTRHFIDCLSAYRRYDRRGDIGILRLDDMAAFYGKTKSPVYPDQEYLNYFIQSP